MSRVVVPVGLVLFLLPQNGSAQNAVTRWTEHSLQAVRAQNVGTPQAGRLYAMVTVAMYDAVNGIDTARNHGGEFALVPPGDVAVYAHAAAAAAAAAHAVLKGLLPAHAGVLDAALAADLDSLGANDPPVRAGRDWGAQVGQLVLQRRASDGTQAAEVLPAGSECGVHRASFDARFRNMQFFGIADRTPYLSAAPPALTSPEYVAAFNDVKFFGVQDGDSVRNQIAQFWLAENNTVRETGIWLQALVAIVKDRGTDSNLSDTARLFAQVGMATADAVSVVWYTKAQYFTWRPFFAIREADLADCDGNPETIADPSWTPRNISIGASPEFNSGTSAFAGAASAVIEQFYCGAAVSFCFATDGAQGIPRCYASALEAAEEAGRSRIYQGIHFQFANEDGRRVGRGIGAEIATRTLQRFGPPGQEKTCTVR
jgi:hypothetical protein